MPAFLAINRNPALLVWDDGLIHHPEDPRLGRITLNALIMAPFSPAEAFRVKNLPPGVYSFFVGPFIAPKGVRVKIVPGEDQTITVDWVRPDEEALVNLWNFRRRVSLRREEYRASELCGILTEEAGSRPEIEVAPSLRDQTVRVGPGEMTLWEVLEAIYAQKRWTVRERGDQALTLSPPRD